MTTLEESTVVQNHLCTLASANNKELDLSVLNRLNNRLVLYDPWEN